MKKHELLKHAYDNYPKGTNFISFADNKEVVASSGKFRVSQNNHQGIWVTDVETSWVVFCPDKKKWAEIVENKEPLLVSEDGVPLYEGDKYWDTFFNEKWDSPKVFTLFSNSVVVTHPNNSQKAFSNKEAAEAWIECANENLQNYQLERLTDKKGYIFVVNHKGTLITYIAKDKKEAEGFFDLWKGFNYTINEITLPKEQ